MFQIHLFVFPKFSCSQFSVFLPVHFSLLPNKKVLQFEEYFMAQSLHMDFLGHLPPPVRLTFLIKLFLCQFSQTQPISSPLLGCPFAIAYFLICVPLSSFDEHKIGEKGPRVKESFFKLNQTLDLFPIFPWAIFTFNGKISQSKWHFWVSFLRGLREKQMPTNTNILIKSHRSIHFPFF